MWPDRADHDHAESCPSMFPSRSGQKHFTPRRAATQGAPFQLGQELEGYAVSAVLADC
jgi:hypothetical protein